METNVVMIDDHIDARRLYAVNLRAYSNANILEFDTLDEGIEFLQSNSAAIIIVRSKMEQRDAGKAIHALVKELKTKLIVMGDSSLTNYDAIIFKEFDNLKKLVQLCAVELGVTAEQMAGLDMPDYYPIPLNLFLDGFELVSPIFKKIDEDEYVQVLDREHKMHKEIIIMLKNEVIEEVYVKSLDRLKFVNSLSVQMAEILNNDHITIQEKINVAGKGHQLVRDAARRMMIESETIQLAETSMETMRSIADAIPKLKELMEMTFGDTMTLMYRHCLMTNYVCAHIIKNIEWGTREQQIKASFVAFFHDIALEKDEYVFIHSEKELNALGLPAEEQQTIRNHALLAAKFVAKYYNSLPFGAEAIIKQHHGSKNGSGLDKISQSISPLAIVFLVAEEWVHQALKAEEENTELTRARLLNHLAKKFNYAAFKKVLKILEKLTI